MKHWVVAAVCGLALTACSLKPHDIKITPELLGDPGERPVFPRYLLSRAAAASPMGEHAILILAPGGKDPATAMMTGAPDGRGKYNAAIDDYNKAGGDFDAKLKAMQAAK